MSKNHLSFSRKVFGWVVLAVSALAFASCAEGFDDNETFTSDVTNSQLTSPELTKDCFETKVKSDGSEQVQVSWKVVHGAGGYLCNVTDVTNTVAPEAIISDSIVDGTSFLFNREEDRNYTVSVQTLGNERYNNTDAAEASTYAYSTFVAGQTIPVGSNIVEFVKNNIIDTEDEQAFELEAGAQYTLDAPLDFGKYTVTFRGNKYNRPTVTLGENGVVRGSNGLKVKFINFDCTNQTANGKADGICGVIEMSSEPDDQFANTTTKHYNCLKPIILQECMFKNVHCCLFASGKCSWGIDDVRVTDCIVQLDNDGTTWSNGAVLCAYSNFYYMGKNSAWYGSIRNITCKNSTFYNIKSNSKNRFIRFNNKDLYRAFSSSRDANDNGTATITNCTFIRCMDGKEFGNNTPNRNNYVITFQNNICHDVYRLQKFIQSNCDTEGVDKATNTIWGVKNSIDNTDKTKWATEEDAGFDVTNLPELDLTKENGGVNFKATGAISSTIGDPRWLD